VQPPAIGVSRIDRWATVVQLLGTFWAAVCFFIGAALLLRSDTAAAPEAAYASSAASMS
jgi:hypothetical protein